MAILNANYEVFHNQTKFHPEVCRWSLNDSQFKPLDSGPVRVHRVAGWDKGRTGEVDQKSDFRPEQGRPLVLGRLVATGCEVLSGPLSLGSRFHIDTDRGGFKSPWSG